jgi:hypothetical protein
MTDQSQGILTEPPVAGDETATLLGSLERERAIFAWKTGGLDAAGLRATVGASPSLRRILIDMIEEYARHVGHADLIRESVDGLVGEDPPR